MGIRANFILRRSNTTRIFFSQFGGDAQVMGEALLSGPESMNAFVHAQIPDEHLLDEITCEGGATIDSTAMRLTWFACADLSPPYRRALWPELVRRWPGWTVEWAEEGVLSLARASGLDPIPLERSECSHPDKAERLEDDEEGTSLVTICEEGGQIRDYRLQPFIGELLAHGPSFLTHLEGRRHKVPREDELSEGALVDCRCRTISAWWASSANNKVIPFLRDLWPGWDVKRQEVGLRLQMEASGRPREACLITAEQANAWLQSLLRHA